MNLGSNLSTKDKLLHIAGQLHQLRRELYECGKDPDYSFAASHAMGVIASGLGYDADKLTELTKGK